MHITESLGGKVLVFHPGYYLKRDKETVYNIIKENIKIILNEIKIRDIKCVLAPETTGKPTQFGSFAETLKLARELGISLTIDFAHLIARDNGLYSIKEIVGWLKRNNLKNIHSHYSGIEYTKKGEKKHIPIDSKETSELFKQLLKNNINANIIIESPLPLEDAIKAKKILDGAKANCS